MSKFKSLLTDDEHDKIKEQANGLTRDAVIRLTEAAVRAKLAAQEPGAWHFKMVSGVEVTAYSTREAHSIRDRLQVGDTETPLYAAPLPAVAQVSQGWQPIETAPKDETILIYQPRFGRVTLSINDGFEYKEATHWMPLPEPPAASTWRENDFT